MRRWLKLCASLFLLLMLPCLAGAEGAPLDLTAETFQDYAALSARVAEANAGIVDLTGVPLTADDRRALLRDFPEVDFRWTLTPWGVSISSEDTEAAFPQKYAGSLDELCDALDCLPKLENVYMWDIQLTRAERDRLFFGYPDIFFGWEIHLNAGHTVRTDTTAFSTLGRKPPIYAHNTGNFIYCKNLLALDVGHNPILNLDFLEKCNKLKILIAVDGLISDLSPLAGQTDLEYVELFMNEITDISPLASLTNLRDLNLAFNDITDLSPLYDLPNLERVWLMMNRRLTQEEVDRLREHQPNCEIVTRSFGSTGNLLDSKSREIPGTSWRHHLHYDTIYYIFHHSEYIPWDVPVPSRVKFLD